jgi:hypothetical protein
LAARKTWPPLVDREHTHARMIYENDASLLLVIERGSENQLIAIANLTDAAVKLPSGLEGRRDALLSTNERRFGGERKDSATFSDLGAYEMVVWGDARWR